MTHIGLFEGIGGFSLAARWMGWETKAWCEWNEDCQAILKQHFPEAEGYGDITQTDFKKYAGTIDVLTGGFPCQPFSIAGKRKGKEDERYLWGEMLRAIDEIKPGYVVAENVYGLLNIDRGRTVEVICTDLESIGYEKPVVFDTTSDCFGLSTLERHIWIITTTVDKRCKRSLQSTDQDKRNTERQISGSYQREGNRWDISETRFCGVGERVSDRLDKSDKARLIQIGNAIPPQAALQIFRVIEKMEQDRIKSAWAKTKNNGTAA